jgi:hypothetical protein
MWREDSWAARMWRSEDWSARRPLGIADRPAQWRDRGGAVNVPRMAISRLNPEGLAPAVGYCQLTVAEGSRGSLADVVDLPVDQTAAS